MRRQKFKIWDTEKDQWFKPTYEAFKHNLEELLIMQNGDLIRRTLDGMYHESTFTNRYKVVYWTGLYDKHGKEIYEGDCLRDGHMVWIVKFCLTKGVMGYGCVETWADETGSTIITEDMEKIGSAVPQLFFMSAATNLRGGNNGGCPGPDKDNATPAQTNSLFEARD